MSADDDDLTDDELATLADLEAEASPTPWSSWVEGRDFGGGNDFIRTGGLDDASPDIELTGATVADQDLIARARNDIGRLIREVRRRRQEQAPGATG